MSRNKTGWNEYNRARDKRKEPIVDKPRLVQVRGEELAAILDMQEQPGCPFFMHGDDDADHIWVDPDELARWRQRRASQDNGNDV